MCGGLQFARVAAGCSEGCYGPAQSRRKNVLMEIKNGVDLVLRQNSNHPLNLVQICGVDYPRPIRHHSCV